MRRPERLTTCSTPDCTGKHKARGLCMLCYLAARFQVRAKRYTWQDLENAGMALPPMRRPAPLRGQGLLELYEPLKPKRRIHNFKNLSFQQKPQATGAAGT